MRPVSTLSFVLVCLFLIGCVTTQIVATGTVIKQLQLKKVDYVPQGGTDTGLVAGAGVGAATGAVMGIGLTVATLGLAAPLIPALTAAGGVAGGTTGAAVGYTTDVAKQGHGLYDYVVELDDTHEKMIVRQYAQKMITDHTRVKIIKENGVLKIIPISNK